MPLCLELCFELTVILCFVRIMGWEEVRVFILILFKLLGLDVSHHATQRALLFSMSIQRTLLFVYIWQTSNHFVCSSNPDLVDSVWLDRINVLYLYHRMACIHRRSRPWVVGLLPRSVEALTIMDTRRVIKHPRCLESCIGHMSSLGQILWCSLTLRFSSFIFFVTRPGLIRKQWNILGFERPLFFHYLLNYKSNW